MTAWYWIAFAVAALIVLIVALLFASFLAFRWEARQERRDAELWQRRFGGDIYRKVNR